MTSTISTATPSERPADEPVRRRCRRSGRSPSRSPVRAHVEVVAEVGREEHEEHVDDALAEVGDDEAEHGDEDRPPRSSGRRGVQPVPLAVGEVRAPRGLGGDGVRSQPRPAGLGERDERSRSALGLARIGRPGMVTAVDAAAVTNLRSARPSARATVRG